MRNMLPRVAAAFPYQINSGEAAHLWPEQSKLDAAAARSRVQARISLTPPMDRVTQLWFLALVPRKGS